MKTWIGFVTCLAFVFSSTYGDSGATFSPADDQPVIQDESEPINTEQEPASVPPEERKPVGQAAVDSSQTASKSKVGTYVLAGLIVAAGITGLILVSKHRGHRK